MQLHRSMRLATLAVCALVVSAVPAGAHLAMPTDPSDTPGLLDIRRASFTHRDGLLRLSATTEDSWAPRILGRDTPGNEINDNALQFQIESRGNFRADYVVVVDYVEDHLEAKLFRFVPFGEQTTQTEFVSFVDVTKDGRTLRVKFPIRRVQPRASHIEWSADSYYMDGCPVERCVDFAPNRYLFRHSLQ